MSRIRKVVVLGLDGLEPSSIESLRAAGELPNLSRLMGDEAVRRLATTFPAQTPVAWSSFATGTNPGGHGIFDFIHRDPNTYLPSIALNTYEQKNMFLPPKAVNRRGGVPIWQDLSKAGIESIVLRCPCTYPPDSFRGRMLAGMGTPDIVGGFGTPTFYSTTPPAKAGESETIMPLSRTEDGCWALSFLGPRHPKTRTRVELAATIETQSGESVILHSPGKPRSMTLKTGQWSDWLRLKFSLGTFQSVQGMVRLLLVRTEPNIELYVSPVNFDPKWPMFPISHPIDYALEIEEAIGTYYTTGMVEDHVGLGNGRFDESAFLAQCQLVMREREAMLHLELDRQSGGLVYCLFDTPDRLQHMFWRFREGDHPARIHGAPAEYTNTIEQHYRDCDAVVGRVLSRIDDQTLLFVLSDHGFGSFRRGVDLNGWLHRQGLLTLTNETEPGRGAMLEGIDWAKTKAYAVGLGSIYLNRVGREREGIVDDSEADAVKELIVRGLSGLVDADHEQTAVTRVMRSEQIYHGPYASQAPDLLACFGRGYRASWGTALGGVGREIFEDNTHRWSGDHIIDPDLVPGFLACNRPLKGGPARMIDLAPSILNALGVPASAGHEGESLLP